MNARSRSTEFDSSFHRRSELALLTRRPAPRALAPDASRARLGAPSSEELYVRQRRTKRAGVMTMLALLVVAAPTLLRAASHTALGRELISRGHNVLVPSESSSTHH